MEKVEEENKTNTEEKKEVVETVEKKEEKKKDKKKQIVKKEKAVVNAKDLPISTKQSMAICKFIKGKSPEKAISELEQVIKLKRAIPMKGEIPHRKGMMSGRYPVNASKVFINLLKSLNANSSVNGIENPVIVIAKPNKAASPFKRGGSQRFKRTNVVLMAKEKIKKEGEKK